MHVIDHNGNGDIDKAVFASIDMVLLSSFKLASQDGVTFDVVDCGFRVDPVEIRAGFLPLGNNRNAPVQVDKGGKSIGDVEELVKLILQGLR